MLKTNVSKLVQLQQNKIFVGTAMAGTVGGYNAHASNIVSAIFIATGQDPAQNVESSHCLTNIVSINDGKDIHASVTMPCIEVNEYCVLSYNTTVLAVITESELDKLLFARLVQLEVGLNLHLNLLA